MSEKVETVFVKNQVEADTYLDGVEDKKSRLLARLALSKTYQTIGTDPAITDALRQQPLDMLIFARILSIFFLNEQLLRKVLDEEVTSIDQLDPFPADGQF